MARRAGEIGSGRGGEVCRLGQARLERAGRAALAREGSGGLGVHSRIGRVRFVGVVRKG
jgi:hypothetical protein